MKVQQGLEGVVVEMTTYRPSRVGQVLAALILAGSIGLLLLALPSATMLGFIVSAMIFLLSGTLTGPTLTVQITPLVLRETLAGRTRSWPLEELRDIEVERWSVLERRMGQIRFSTPDGTETIGGGNRFDEVRWLGGVLERMVMLRRENISARDPEARMEVRPPAALMSLIEPR